MLLHALNDTVSFIQSGGLSGADSDAVISGSVQSGNTELVFAGQFVFYVAVTLFVLRRKKVEPLLKNTETEAEEEAWIKKAGRGSRTSQDSNRRV